MFSMNCPINAVTVDRSNKVATIDADLQTILADAVSSDRIPVDIWLYETTSAEVREEKIYTKIGLDKETIVSATKNALSTSTVDKYIATERAVYAAERMSQYSKLKLDYSYIVGLQETRKVDTYLFYSMFAPMISAELTREEIELLACDSRIQTIYYSPDLLMEPEGDISVPLINADYTRDTLGYSGTGIKIGLLEARGLPNKNKSYFSADKIIYDPSVNQSQFDDHAEQVAAVMVAKPHTINGVTYEGVVPNAKLYATYAGTMRGMFSRIEWLLSQGVNVINMSAGSAATSDETYDSYELWLDHVAVQHSVHFVKSAGNSNGFISRPGMAYNILTIGAVNDKNTIRCDDDVRYDLWQNNNNYGSSYIEAEQLTNKPDLMAPGVYINSGAYLDGSNYANHGTSLSAPHVTGVIAQLCEHIGSLKVMPATVKAILTASICHSKFAYDTGFVDADNYDKFGAGVINAKEAFETVLAFRMMGGYFSAGTASQTERVYTFSASEGQRVRVSLTWLKYSSFDDGALHAVEGQDEYPSSGNRLFDLDLCLYDPNGALVGDWRADENNTEIADFIAAQAGTYTIKVVQCETATDEITYGLAWWLGSINNLSTSS